MNLKIKDFGVIKNADIKVDGITVITGNNNTGKSTIGKVFFSYFNSFHDMEIKIDNVLKAICRLYGIFNKCTIRHSRIKRYFSSIYKNIYKKIK